MTAFYEQRGAERILSPAESEQTRKRIVGFWYHCEPAARTPAAAYLEQRGIGWLVQHADVRFRPECSHPTGARLPAMIWCVKDAAGNVCCLHRTYLTLDGSKAAVDPPKATWGPFAGGAVRLHPACPEMVVGEGIETTAAAANLLELPGWAAVACGNLRARMVLPDTVKKVTIAVDHDPAGQRAARRAAIRWRKEGRRVHLAMPDRPGQDFNDVLRERAHA